MSIELSAAIRDRVRAYAGPFEAHPPAILSLFSGRTEAGTSDDGFFPFPADSDRGLGILLLTASLFRPGRPASGAGDPGSGHGGPSSGPDEVRPVAGAADAGHVHPGQEPEPVGRGVWDEGRPVGHGYGADEARVIAGLYHQYGTDIFRLNRLPFEALRGRTEALAAHWDVAERARIPGILRSVCDFFYRVGPLVSWMAAADWEQRAGEIAQEIYWMGARSPTRTKARLFFWLACGIPGFGHRDDMRARARDFAWPTSDGHLRVVYDILGPARMAGGPSAVASRPSLGVFRGAGTRGEAFAALARALFPEAPWRLYQPFEAFLKPERGGSFRCRTVQGGCRPCALAPVCPAARNFLPREGNDGPLGLSD